MARIPSYSKINLSLELLGSRPDGYTEIRTVYQSLDLSDELDFEFLEESGGAAGGIEFHCSDPQLPAGEDNLVVRAARLLQEAAAGMPVSGRPRTARIRLHKRIPAGAGLGGGSADAATTLLALDRMWGTGLGPAGLQGLAAGLGSDVPFFLHGGTMLGRGRGELVEPLPDAPPGEVVLALPPFRIATAAAYREAAKRLTPRGEARSIWRFSPDEPSVNELEQAAADVVPGGEGRLLALLKACLLDGGARAAALCGSGSAVFGIFGSPASGRPGSASGADGAGRVAQAVSGDFPGVTVFRCRTLDSAGYRSNVHERIAAVLETADS